MSVVEKARKNAAESMKNHLGPDDVTATNTVAEWRDKLSRERRSKQDWHYRWGDTYGAGMKPLRKSDQVKPSLVNHSCGREDSSENSSDGGSNSNSG